MKEKIHHDQVEYISGMQNWFNTHKAVNIIHDISNLQKTNCMIILMNNPKELDKYLLSISHKKKLS